MNKLLATMTAAASLAFTIGIAGQVSASPRGAAPHPRNVAAPSPVHPVAAPHKIPYQHRMENQQDRLNRAYSKGKISHSEYVHDTNKLDKIRSSERQDMRSNGKFTAQERAQTRSELKHSGNRIHKDKVQGPPR